ncbi:MAG: formate-dependent phosphoribosylglycinamide formyltransferase [Polyangiaceae bacterium]
MTANASKRDSDQPSVGVTLGTPYYPGATKILLLGSGELGREVVLEAMRLGVEVVACDRYENAPAMQFAHRSHVIDMLDPAQIRRVVMQERPSLIVPEIEAIATQTLVELEAEGWTVIPTARATQLTMDRQGIRSLAAEELKLPTGAYRFAESLAELEAAVAELGLPCVVKPVMSSSGKGQSTVKTQGDVQRAWDYAMSGSRGKSARIIVEAFVEFDTEITLLTVRTKHEGTLFCPPIGHRQERGDYQESWQPEALSALALERAQDIAERITGALGGLGLFGVEMFIKGDDVLFSEVSPRPHDTGMVTLATQDMSEFELHARAILGLPIGSIIQRAPGASAVILAEEAGVNPRFVGVEGALGDPRNRLRLFAKPDTRRYRRMGVVATYGEDVQECRERAQAAARAVRVEVDKLP